MKMLGAKSIVSECNMLVPQKGCWHHYQIQNGTLYLLQDIDFQKFVLRIVIGTTLTIRPMPPNVILNYPYTITNPAQTAAMTTATKVPSVALLAPPV
jgi:hypothetical protein